MLSRVLIIKILQVQSKLLSLHQPIHLHLPLLVLLVIVPHLFPVCFKVALARVPELFNIFTAVMPGERKISFDSGF